MQYFPSILPIAIQIAKVTAYSSLLNLHSQQKKMLGASGSVNEQRGKLELKKISLYK